MKNIIVSLQVFVLTIICFGIAVGGEQKKVSTYTPMKLTGTGPFATLVNINNVAMWIRHDGFSARNPNSGNSGVSFPRGTSTAIFADGLIWGGNVNDGGSQVLRVGGQTYQVGTVGGRIVVKGVAEDRDGQSVRIYRIRRDWETANLRQDAAELEEKALSAVTDAEIAVVREQYKTDWLEWPWQKGAPFYDRDGDGEYHPDPNGKYDPTKDEPGLADADQVVWFVMNDLNSAQTQSFLGSDPIGLEVQTTLWGYARTDPLGNVIFKKFRYIYKGTAASVPGSRIEDFYVGQWSDPDLGDYSDDYEGCDTSLSLGFVYNASAEDANYRAFGLKPPASGYDFLQGPIVDGVAGQDLNKNGIDDSLDYAVFNLQRVGPGKINLPMTSWIYFAAGGTYSDPPFSYVGAGQWYNLLRGLTPVDGTPFTYPGATEPTKFWLSGDPVAGTGYVDGVIDAPGDRRMMLSTGPIAMALGDTQEVVVALLCGIGTSSLSSVSVLKNVDVAVQRAYDDLFDLPKAPPAPKLKIVELDRQLVLDWGSDEEALRTTEDFDRKGYSFQGYNVYQLPSASAGFDQAIKLATYDIQDAVRTIYDDVFNVTTGIIERTIKQRGTDSGIKRELNITTDARTNLPLWNGQRYYFAVTAYGYNPSDDALTHALESPLQIMSAVPQESKPGFRYSSKYGDAVNVTNTNPGKKSDGEVKVSVVDPKSVTGKPYRITFQNIQTTFVYHGTDTVVAPILNWFVIRDTGTVAETLRQSVNQGPIVVIDPGNHDDILPTFGNDFDYPIVDGLFITVKGPPPLINEERTSWTGTEWWTGDVSELAVTNGFTLGGPGARKLNNMATTAYDMTNYLGAVNSRLDPSEYVDIEFRFGEGGSLTQKAYQYHRGASGIESGSQYKFQGYVDVPFQVFDISDPQNPRQLNVGWRDQNLNAQWDPNSNLEIIFVAKSTYDGNTPSTYGTTVGSSVNNIVNSTRGTGGDVMFIAEWWTGSSGPGISGIQQSTIRISPNYVNSAQDVFAMTAPAASAYVASTAKADVEKIKAFPNPYYGFNKAETNRFQKFVTFSHLPPGDWRIRIFNLAGTLVRYIDPNSPSQSATSQFATWDLNNQSGLPVASGVYIAHIEMPKLGSEKILKIVIIQEQQVLDFY